MTDTFARLRHLFEQCVDLPEGERMGWLEQNVPDTGRRITLELMLAADRHEDGFLRRDVASHIGRFGAHVGEDDINAEHLAAGLVGRRFGTFELRHLIGRGGQGAVYQAERVGGDFHQTVAVKLLRKGIHDPDEHRRFRREREILARFEHPGVARLIDGGVSTDGVPYLAMEYVDGCPIDAWCAQRSLDIAACLRLFCDLCEVVSAAQRALIVHRDLKPSNVLVTPAGDVKVLDFGIARLLDDSDAGSDTRTPMMTPGYGAPEQAACGPITLATDVYALGVLLRVLLTGEAPSTHATRATPAMPHSLPAELRWIVGKACAPEPERRYRDAAELDEDVRRFLDARPVRAHPPSRAYRVRKFVQRHRGSMLVSAAVVIAILASLGLSLWQANVAREQAQRAEAARDFLLGVFEAAGEDLPKDARPTPDVLAQAAAKKLEGDVTLKPAMRAEFLATLGEIAKNSNDLAGALAFYDKAASTLEAVGDTGSRQHLAVEVMRVWVLTFLGRSAEAVEMFQPRLAALRAVTDATTVDGLWAYGDALEDSGRINEAVTLVAEARELAAQVYADDSIDRLRLSLAYSHSLNEAGRLQEGAAMLGATLDRWHALGIPEQQDYATALANLSSLKRRLGDYDAAIHLMREALRVSQSVHPGAHQHNAIDMQYLGRMLAERGEFTEAQTLLRDATTMMASLFEPGHPQVIGMLGSQASFDYERQNYAQSAIDLERSVDLCVEAKLDGETRCATNWQLFASTLLRLGRIDEADVAITHSLRMRKQLEGDDNPDYAIPLRVRGDVLLSRTQPAAALAVYDAVLAMYARANISGNLEIASAHSGRARSLLALDRPADALASLDQADEITRRIAARNPGRQLRLAATRVEALATLQRNAEAKAEASRAMTFEAARAALESGEWERIASLAR